MTLIYRILSIEMENPNTSPTWKIAFGLSLLGTGCVIGFEQKVSNTNDFCS